MTTEQNKSQPQHTPGPWRFAPCKSMPGDIEILIGDYQKFYVPLRATNLTDTDAKIRKANARLIAAAPELLEAGIDLHAELYNLRNLYSKIQEYFGYKPEQIPHIELANVALKKWVAAIAKAKGETP